MVTLFPVLGQAQKSHRQHMGGKVFSFHGRQYQKTGIAHQTAKIGSASRLCPSNILIPASKHKGSRTESQSSKIAVNGTLHNVSDLSSAQRTAAQIVISVQKGKPYFGFPAISACDRIHGHFTQFRQRTMELSNIHLRAGGGRAFEPIGSFPHRQLQYPSAVQLSQCFATAHILETTTGGTPVQPLANPPGQLQSRNSGLHA